MKKIQSSTRKTAFVLCVLAGLLSGCAQRAGRVQVVATAGSHQALSEPHSFFVDRTAESPFGKREHERLCVRLERAMQRQGWRLEPEERAAYRVDCGWSDVQWQHVHRAPRVPMTRYWYVGSVYDPQGPAYALPGKSGMFRPRESTLSAQLWRRGVNAPRQPERRATLVQSGAEVGEESAARLVQALIGGDSAPAASR
jgi:hypothetical protein